MFLEPGDLPKEEVLELDRESIYIYNIIFYLTFNIRESWATGKCDKVKVYSKEKQR